MSALSTLRKNKNFTQQQVADSLGISRQAYANYEAGKRQPDPEMLMKLSEFFEVSIDIILDNPHSIQDPEVIAQIALFGGKVSPELWQKAKEYAQFLATFKMNNEEEKK